MKDIELILLQATRNSEQTIAQLARQANLPYSSVHGFVVSGRQITLHTAAALSRVLQLELVAKGSN